MSADESRSRLGAIASSDIKHSARLGRAAAGGRPGRSARPAHPSPPIEAGVRRRCSDFWSESFYLLIYRTELGDANHRNLRGADSPVISRRGLDIVVIAPRRSLVRVRLAPLRKGPQTPAFVLHKGYKNRAEPARNQLLVNWPRGWRTSRLHSGEIWNRDAQLVGMRRRSGSEPVSAA
jgi:hypothetical protein